MPTKKQRKESVSEEEEDMDEEMDDYDSEDDDEGESDGDSLGNDAQMREVDQRNLLNYQTDSSDEEGRSSDGGDDLVANLEKQK